MVPRDWLGQLVESRDGECFGKVVMYEENHNDSHHHGGDVVMLKVYGPGVGGGEKRIPVHISDFNENWTLLGRSEEINVPEVYIQSCLRCHRLNYGPCISATCQ